jgi:hypothetical protein
VLDVIPTDRVLDAREWTEPGAWVFVRAMTAFVLVSEIALVPYIWINGCSISSATAPGVTSVKLSEKVLLQSFLFHQPRTLGIIRKEASHAVPINAL